MNELLQKHGCSAVFSVPEGLKELMSDITREVLRDQPPKIFDYIANYLSVLLITREHGILAVRIMEDLCDCRASVSEHLLQLGIERPQAETLSQIVKEEIEGFEPVEGKEKVKETQILKKILTRMTLDEDMSAKVCQVARNAYRDYWYRKKMMEKNLKVHPDEPWEIAAQHTLELYKRTKPSFSELTIATLKIQAAYRGYHVRRKVLRHLKPKHKKTGPKVELPGPPLDIAGSREIDLGPVIDIKVREDDVGGMFDQHVGTELGLQYDPMKTITHVDPEEIDQQATRAQSRVATFAKSDDGQLAHPDDVEIIKTRMTMGTNLQEPRPSQLLPTEPPSQMLPAQAPSQLLPAQAPSQLLPSQAPSQMLPAQAPSQPLVSEHASLHRISFAEEPPEIIADEVPEDLPEAALDNDMPQDVPEDIPDDHSEGDGQSEPLSSVPTSAPTTDGEDAPTTDEE